MIINLNENYFRKTKIMDGDSMIGAYQDCHERHPSPWDILRAC